MASQGNENGSPWASSAFLPFGRPSRRSSVTSLSSRVALNRETLSQALDDIHSSASQATNLITFKDFAPPPAAPKDEERPSTQSGIGNLYARFRPSPSSNKERPSSASSRKHRKTTSDTGNNSAPQTPSALSFPQHDETTSNFPGSPPHVKSPGSGHTSLQSLSHEPPRRNPDSLDQPSPSKKTQGVQDTHLDVPGDKYMLSNTGERHVSTSAIPDEELADISGEGEKGSLNHARALSHDEQKESQPDPDDRSLMASEQDPQDRPLQEPRSMQRSKSPIKITPTSPIPPQLWEGTLKPRGGPFAALSKVHVARSSASDITEFNTEADGSPAKSDVHTPILLGQSPNNSLPVQTNNLIHEMRRKVLHRDFWMKDENAKVCFNCGDGFTAFRRKHHCRTCGQIYDAKCTVIIPGRMFGQEGRLRICKTCENMIMGDDSSEFSEEEDHSAPTSHAKSIRFSGLPPAPGHSNKRSSLIEASTADSLRPTLDPRRRTTPNPFETFAPTLTRPSSSRSLKSITSRPRSSSHRHRRSRHQHMKSIPLTSYESTPVDKMSFHTHGATSEQTFHSEDIIDPDLAPFMSDEGSSEEEPHSIAAALHGSVSGPLVNSQGIQTVPAKKSRPRPTSSRSLLDLTQHGRDPDNISLRSSRPGTRRRQVTRTMSMGSAMGWPALSPRVIRSENIFTDGHGFFDSTTSLLTQEPSTLDNDEPAIMGLRTPTAPLAELNKPSLEHFKTLLRQLLSDTSLANAKRWEKSLVPILLRCAEEVDPNIQRGDDIDIRHYVKLKKAPGGQIRDTTYVSGVVFSKNVALKGMRRFLKNPRLLLVSFPLIYARHQQHFMSLDAVIAQEKEYLRNLVKRIVALKPNIILAQKEVAGFVLELLKKASITVVRDVKESVLQAVSRCTQTLIISSMDQLSMDSKYLGTCESFDVKTVVFGKYKKSYVFVSGCQKDLGCTIILRGTDRAKLHKVKWITEFMCYVAYNLKLETSLIRDQFSLTPRTYFDAASEAKMGTEQAVERNGTLSRRSSHEKDHKTQRDSKRPRNNSELRSSFHIEDSTQDETDRLCEFGRIYSNLKTRVLSVSPSVKLSEPHLLLKGLAQERHLKMLKERYRSSPEAINKSNADSTNRAFELITPDLIDKTSEVASQMNRNMLEAIQNAEYSKADQYYATLRRRWETFIAGSRDPFSPLSHQQIVVLFSVVSIPSMNACEGPDLLGLGYYQEHGLENDLEPDMPLGEYVERTCEQAEYPCLASRCEKKMIDHHRHYVHGDGQISVIAERLSSKLRGLQNTILMWSVCRECQQETPVVPMSRNTWKYSFAKYLELSFWSSKLEPRAGICPHDIHKSHTRYFGFNNLAISIKYDSINIMEVNVPRNVVFWKVDKDIVIKNDQFTRIEERLQRFMNSVISRIDSINLENVNENNLEKCKLELDSFREKVGEEHGFLKRKLQDKYSGSQYYEIIPLNRAVRAIQEKVAGWDSTFADFERKYFPSEKDIRRLAAQQLKNAYLARSEIAEAERIDEKDGLASPVIADTEQPNSPVAKSQRTEIPQEPMSKIKQESPKSARSISRSKTDFGSQSSSETPAIPIGSTANRMVDELDLAKSPESPDARQKAAALDLQESKARSNDIESIEPATDRPAEESSKASAGVHEGSPDSAGHKQDISMRRRGGRTSPMLSRSRTQPAPVYRNIPQSETELVDSTKASQIKSSIPSLIPVSKGTSHHQDTSANSGKSSTTQVSKAVLAGKGNLPSMIPRSKNYRRLESRVSALAKHFEQMSREFERERLRERRQRAARVYQAQVYSTASVQPVVEVFRDADAAVNEHEHAAEDQSAEIKYAPKLSSDAHALGKDTEPGDQGSQTPSERARVSHRDSDMTTDEMKSEESTINLSGTFSDNDTLASDVEATGLTDSEEIIGKLEAAPESPDEVQLELLDIPKQDKTSIMKMLTSFWSERSASGWAPLEYPLVPTDHIFADSDIILREDEPSSLIAFALGSKDYISKLGRFRDRVKTQPLSPTQLAAEETDVERTLLGSTATHLKYQFQAGPARMQCKLFYAEAFDAIRQRCGVSERFVESLSRCLKWDSRGGKTKSIFLKTMDERFVLKSLSPVEAQAFLRFAPDYFDYMSKCLFHSLPSALAKILGVYEVIIKNPVTGVDFSCFLQVMENVFYEGQSNRMFDLKGSMRNRKVQSTGEKNEVLLDENLLDYISQTPMYVRNHANSFLTSSISNDTLFCAKQNVMDYSLIVGLYEDRQELMVGIIDYIRTYTWDKKLESWIKDRGKNKPTVRSPREYRNRFRASIARYFPLAPSCWQIFGVQRTGPSKGWLDASGAMKEPRAYEASEEEPE